MRKIRIGYTVNEDNVVVPQYARDPETYRSRRRNRARKPEDWQGVETKLRPEPPALTRVTSKRGETHYVELPW